MVFSKQTREAYKYILGNENGVTVAEIASKLRVSASDVYRLTKPLLEIGLVLKSEGRPFKLHPGTGGLDLFLTDKSLWFTQNFGANLPQRNGNQMDFEFIQGRDELMKESAVEIDKCTRSVDLLRSGHEIPSETMAAMVNAIKRGVKIRMLVQEVTNENREMVENWIRNGIMVRQTELKRLRIMIYDSKVGFFTSYKHLDSSQDVGMKIVYPPFAIMLSRYFEDLWKKAKKVK